MATIARGADQLEDLGRALKHADKQLKKDMLRAFREAGKPVVKDIKARAGDSLPASGGFASRVARSTIGVRTRLSGKSTGIRIQASGKKGATTATIKGLDESGEWRHPVWGNRSVWVSQSAAGAIGWFSEPIEDNEGRLRSELLDAMDRTAEAIARSV